MSCCSLRWKSRKWEMVSFPFRSAPKKYVVRAELKPVLRVLPVVERSRWRMPMLVWERMMLCT